MLSGLKLARIKCDDKDALVEESLERASLWREVRDRLDKPGGALSGGQQQRLCIARSLAVQPNVLLMDEPCSALDPTSTRRIEETIAELRDQVTVVIVTHNMQQAHRVSDYTAFFLAAENEPGYVVEQGPTEKIFSNPDDHAHARLRARVGSDEPRRDGLVATSRSCSCSLAALLAAIVTNLPTPAAADAAPAAINGQGSSYVGARHAAVGGECQTRGSQRQLPADRLAARSDVVQPEPGRLRRHRGRVLRAAGRRPVAQLPVRAGRRRRGGDDVQHQGHGRPQGRLPAPVAQHGRQDLHR